MDEGPTTRSTTQATGLLYGAHYGPLANYFVKFLEAYAKPGVPISTITPQNEPGRPPHDLPRDEPVRARRGEVDRRRHRPGAEGGPAARRRSTAMTSAVLRSVGIALRAGVARSIAASVLHGIAWHCYHGSPDRDVELEHNLLPNADRDDGRVLARADVLDLRDDRLVARQLGQRGGPLQPRARPSARPGPAAESRLPAGAPPRRPSIRAAETFGLNLNFYQLGQASHFIDRGAARIASQNHFSYNDLRQRSDDLDAGARRRGAPEPERQQGAGRVQQLGATRSGSGSSTRIGGSRTRSLPAKATVTFEWDKPAALDSPSSLASRTPCESSRASSRPGASTSATTSARSRSTSPARTAARRSTASSTCTRSRSPTSRPRCASRCTTRRRSLLAAGLDPEPLHLLPPERRPRAHRADLAAVERDRVRRAEPDDAVQGEVGRAARPRLGRAVRLPGAAGRGRARLPRARGAGRRGPAPAHRADARRRDALQRALRRDAGRARGAGSRRSARGSWTSRTPTKKMSTTGGTPQGTVLVLDDARHDRRRRSARR